MKVSTLKFLKNKSLKALLRQIQNRKVLVVGDVGLDRYLIGSVDRISPEAPVPIVVVESEKLKLGLAANVADNIRALGGVPVLIGVLGKDAVGKEFLGLLTQQKIRADFLVTDARRKTVLKERIVSDRQQLLRVDFEDSEPLRKGIQLKILQKLSLCLDQVEIVVIEDYAKGLVTQELIAEVIRQAQQLGKKVLVDPNSATPLIDYQGAYLLTPNLSEAQSLAGIAIHDSFTLKTAAEKIMDVLNLNYLLITRGKEGMALFSKDRQVVFIPAVAKEVYDVSGAGDTVIAAISLALAAGVSIEQAAWLGNLAAGIEVSKRGTATVSPEEILRHYPF